jgi:hypothetical protein
LTAGQRPDATVEAAHIRVHGARKLPDNRPTVEGVKGSRKILEIARSLDEDDLDRASLGRRFRAAAVASRRRLARDKLRVTFFHAARRQRDELRAETPVADQGRTTRAGDEGASSR